MTDHQILERHILGQMDVGSEWVGVMVGRVGIVVAKLLVPARGSPPR